ncbi:cytochrome C oxidase subunit II [Frondihabitans sp. PAMC 28766]|uniref:aa3-type cytochrome oxidase subunit II n=1 Tax=Frondihabitans sp. PAMC 28766 TaxID=1795630 RepID=UPI00078C40FD|nr:cytochrome c oxidase subunit II [Frondihabitans sp. PAMC 28766]AMM20736.1 cytochrome C oxidase subunit II [Frondihabitans sp. PAMC 28766]
MRSKRRLRLAALPAAAGLILALSGCSQQELRGWLPGTSDNVTNHTSATIGLWVTSWIVLLAVGLITWALIIWAVVVYRRRKNQTGLPVQLRYNMPIEIFYTIVPLFLVLGFFFFTARDQANIEKPTAHPYAKITVYGKRWAWDFQYNDTADIKNSVYTQGIQAQELGNGNVDESKLPVLYLPKGKSVEIELKSRDVIHDFWVIDFLYKKDMIPGKTNYEYFTPMKEGTYAGKCAELCGEYHSLMLFNVKVVSPSAYQDYLATLRQDGNVGDIGNSYDQGTNNPTNTAPVAAGATSTSSK